MDDAKIRATSLLNNAKTQDKLSNIDDMSK